MNRRPTPLNRRWRVTKFAPLSTYAFNVAVGAAYAWATAWVSWLTWNFALQGEDLAALLNAIALVFWGGRLGEFYFEVFHGPLDRVAEKRFALRRRRAWRLAGTITYHVRGTVRPGAFVILNPDGTVSPAKGNS